MKQVLFENTDKSFTRYTYVFSKDNLSHFLILQYNESSFLVTLPDQIDIEAVDLYRGINITDYVEWEAADVPESYISIKGHITNADINIPASDYNRLTKQLISYFNSGGIDKILDMGYILEDEIITMFGEITLTTNENISYDPKVVENE